MMRSFRLPLVCVLLLPLRAWGQAWNYPAFQPPRVVSREFNFAVFNGGDGGTGLLAQWREGIAPNLQGELEVGFVSPSHDDTHALLGGSLGYQIARESAEVPLDFLLTGGIYDAPGNANVLRIPFGLSVGHRFPLKNQLAITPFVEPRLSIDHSSFGDGSTKLGVGFDIGGNFELTPQFALRLLGTFGGANNLPNDPGIGFSVAWTPLGLVGARK